MEFPSSVIHDEAEPTWDAVMLLDPSELLTRKGVNAIMSSYVAVLFNSLFDPNHESSCSTDALGQSLDESIHSVETSDNAVVYSDTAPVNVNSVHAAAVAFAEIPLFEFAISSNPLKSYIIIKAMPSYEKSIPIIRIR